MASLGEKVAPGGIAQLGECRVRNAKARGSSPLTSTNITDMWFYKN